MKWLILVLGIAANASASVLVKMAMMPPRRFPSLNDPLVALSNWPFWLGLGLYGGAFLLYAAAVGQNQIGCVYKIVEIQYVQWFDEANALVARQFFVGGLPHCGVHVYRVNDPHI